MRITVQAGAALFILAAGQPGFAADEVLPPGAKMPFTTFEAEAQTTNGRVVSLDRLPNADDSTPELEASGRSFVRLSAPGQYVEIAAGPSANAMVLRHCIPDAVAGGGRESSINLYVNGELRQKLPLSSKYNWLYGQPSRNGQSNNPEDGEPHVYWDDSRFLLDSGINAGDTLRLQFDAGDVEFVLIDLVDLEVAPPPLEPPTNRMYLSATDYGATPNDDTDDTDALEKCLAEARTQGRIVWIPPGEYRQSRKLRVDGLIVQGAGMWHTTLAGVAPAEDFAGNVGFELAGDGATVTDLAVTSLVDTARTGLNGSRPFSAVYENTMNWRVERVWVGRVHDAFWMSGTDYGVIRGCRIYLTYADGININRGTRNCLVEHNYVRGTGDDGLAILSEETLRGTPNRKSLGNTLRHNTVIANWWGHNIALGGGDGHVVEDNYLADNAHAGVFCINLFSAMPRHPLTGTVIQRNVLVRGGSNYGNARRGAIWINTGYTTATGVTFRDNHIIDPLFRGVHLVGGQPQHLVFENNVIENPGEDAVIISREVSGSGRFIHNTFRGVKPGFVAIKNDGGDDFALTDTDSTIE